MPARPLIPLALTTLLLALPACGSGQKDASPEDRPPFDPSSASPEQVARGRDLYQYQGCLTCHSIDGRKLVGPSLRHLYGSEQWLTNGEKVVVDAPYIRRSLIDPDAEIAEGYLKGQMLNYKDRLTDDDIDALIAFIASLSGEAASTQVGPTDLGLRADGRPSWWFDGVMREGPRLRACGESLAPDLAGARTGAVANARSALRTQLAAETMGPLPGEKAELSTVWPLPNPGGDLRYAGYVMLSAPTADGPDEP